MFLLQHVPEHMPPGCKGWAGNLGGRHLIFNNRARQALSLLLIPAKDGNEDGTPVAADTFFDQMEIYSGMRLRSYRSPRYSV